MIIYLKNIPQVTKINTRVFISHKKEDSGTAQQIAVSLKAKNIEYYLDIFDQEVNLYRHSATTLTQHLETNLANCNTLLAILSDNTQHSWWVPYEIGYIRALGCPIAVWDQTKKSNAQEYLIGWPTIRQPSDWLKYIDWLQSDVVKSGEIQKSLENTGLDKIASTAKTADALENRLRDKLTG